jgi:pimeloyl-ACP methyl ester carboxylesterase
VTISSVPVDGFRLAYDRTGSGRSPVVVLHGWPGDRTDFADVAARLGAGGADVIAPDLRGFGESDKHLDVDVSAYGAAGQARSVIGLMDELGVERAVLAGYDLGSRTAQAVAREHPDRVRALVVTPPVPGVGHRVLDPAVQREFWYHSTAGSRWGPTPRKRSRPRTCGR